MEFQRIGAKITRIMTTSSINCQKKPQSAPLVEAADSLDSLACQQRGMGWGPWQAGLVARLRPEGGDENRHQRRQQRRENCIRKEMSPGHDTVHKHKGENSCQNRIKRAHALWAQPSRMVLDQDDTRQTKRRCAGHFARHKAAIICANPVPFTHGPKRGGAVKVKHSNGARAPRK